jgi:DNA invertase Pin-like site-specific DNA recombinase
MELGMLVNKAIAVIRVSTTEQKRSSLGLKAQLKAIKEFCSNEDMELIGTYEDVCSGKVAPEDRDGLCKALELSKKTGAKIIVHKLDRLSRSVEDIARLMNQGVPFVIVETPQATNFMLHIYSAIAEMERQTISQRIKNALAIKKEELAKEGKKLGNPTLHLNRDKIVKASLERGQKTVDRYLPLIMSVRDELIAKGQVKKNGEPSLRAICDVLNIREIKTTKGGKFYPQTIKLIMLRGETGK